ncbi:MAG: hypothetical protein TU36_002560 [Vulcanisaeta sp. AZ3]
MLRITNTNDLEIELNVAIPTSSLRQLEFQRPNGSVIKLFRWELLIPLLNAIMMLFV